MATEIKRVRFFDGQFLKELEFRDEQAYHMHLRRRMNFFLFGESGVVQVGANDLKFINISVSNKTFQVQAGMAICRRASTQEGKEVVLFLDSAPIDLDNEGITAGGTAFIALHWEEEELKDPASEGDVDENTRVREKAVITVHNAAPPATAANGEENILLGKLPYNSMVPDYTVNTARQEAKLRTSLVGAAPPPSGTLVSIAISAPIGALPLPGGSTQFSAIGTFSSGPTQNITSQVTWNNSAPGVASLSATGLANAVSLGSTNITAQMNSITSPAFGLVVGVAVIAAWPTVNDRRRNGGQTLIIPGTGFAAPMSVIFLGPNVGDPDVIVAATVISQTTAEVIVPGPAIPTGGNPALVRSGQLRVTTTAGTSALSPQAFVLNVT